MLTLILVLAVLCLAVIAGPHLADHQGFVHIVAGDYVIECSLTTAVIVILVGCALLYLVLSLIAYFLSMPGGISRWLGRHGLRKSRSLQEMAELRYAEGNYQEALDLLLQSDALEKLPARSLMLAARACFYLEDTERTREYIDLAQRLHPQAHLALGVLRARLNLRLGNARAALESLDDTGAGLKNRLLGHLYYECYLQEGDLERFGHDAPRLSQLNVISAADADRLILGRFEKTLKNAASGDAAEAAYRELDRATRARPRILGAYVNRLVRLNDLDRARSLAIKLLKKHPEAEFIESIAAWPLCIEKVLETLRNIEQQQETSSPLTLPLHKAIGNLLFRKGQTQDALDRYRKALEIAQTADIYAKLGLILNERQDYAEAATCYRKAYLTREAVKLPEPVRETKDSAVIDASAETHANPEAGAPA